MAAWRRTVLQLCLWFFAAGWVWDWLLALAIVVVNFTIPGVVVPAVERIYFPDDPALRYPPRASWLSEKGKFPVEFGVPLLCVAAAQAWGRSWIDWHHFALALVEGFAVETSFKKWMNLVGKQRPDWNARLASGDPEAIREGRTSYPSGHAAETTMTFGLLSLYLLARLRLFTSQSQAHFAKVMLCLAPLGFAAFITMGRVAAYKHDFSDVNAGFIIGLCSGWLAYLINYESPLSHALAGQPRLRRQPPVPGWLRRLLGADAARAAEAAAWGSNGSASNGVASSAGDGRRCEEAQGVREPLVAC